MRLIILLNFMKSIFEWRLIKKNNKSHLSAAFSGLHSSTPWICAFYVVFLINKNSENGKVISGDISVLLYCIALFLTRSGGCRAHLWRQPGTSAKTPASQRWKTKVPGRSERSPRLLSVRLGSDLVVKTNESLRLTVFYLFISLHLLL